MGYLVIGNRRRLVILLKLPQGLKEFRVGSVQQARLDDLSSFRQLKYDEIMKAASRPAKIEAEIWTRILYPVGNVPARAASAILQLTFTGEQRQRMRELAAKARQGTLSAEEEMEMEEFERVGDLLSILKSKARQTLKATSSKG